VWSDSEPSSRLMEKVESQDEDGNSQCLMVSSPVILSYDPG